MAALSWLMNLDFAASASVISPPSVPGLEWYVLDEAEWYVNEGMIEFYIMDEG